MTPPERGQFLEEPPEGAPDIDQAHAVSCPPIIQLLNSGMLSYMSAWLVSNVLLYSPSMLVIGSTFCAMTCSPVKCTAEANIGMGGKYQNGWGVLECICCERLYTVL